MAGSSPLSLTHPSSMGTAAWLMLPNMRPARAGLVCTCPAMAGFRAATPDMLMVRGPVVYTPVHVASSSMCVRTPKQVVTSCSDLVRLLVYCWLGQHSMHTGIATPNMTKKRRKERQEKCLLLGVVTGASAPRSSPRVHCWEYVHLRWDNKQQHD